MIERLPVTKSTFLAIFGGFVVAIAITLNFYFDEVEEKASDLQKTPPSNKTLPIETDSPEKGVTLNKEASPQQKVNKPSFDVVRVNPDGDTVIAGRAAPEAKVEIFDGKKQIGEVLADKRGEWVFLPSSPLPPGNRRLSLMMTDENDEKIDSENALVLLVPEKGKDIAGRPSQALTQPLALKVPIGDEGSIEVLQKSIPATMGESVIEFAVDAIDYNERGKLNIVGKAPKQAHVQFYLNEKILPPISSIITLKQSCYPTYLYILSTFFLIDVLPKGTKFNCLFRGIFFGKFPENLRKLLETAE